MKAVCLLALLIASPAPAATLPSPNWPAPAERGPALLRHSVLDAHNRARGQFGVAPLAWSDALASDAMAHAQYMACTGNYGHDQTPGRRKKSGENLWRGTRGVFSYDVMIGVMIAEAKDFRPGVFPNISRTGVWNDVAALHPDRLADDDQRRLRARLQRDQRLFRLPLFADRQQGRLRASAAPRLIWQKPPRGG